MDFMLGDLTELETLLGIPHGDVSQRKKLAYVLETVTGWAEEMLDRSFRLKSRTEYYAGRGTNALLLRARPVFTTPAVQAWVSDTGYWGQASGAFSGSADQLTYGSDFALKIDQEDGTSRSGILVRLNGVWGRALFRRAGDLSPHTDAGLGNVKVTYTAGYTVDTLPAALRGAVHLGVGKLFQTWPNADEVSSESYEERSVSYVTSEELGIKRLMWPMLQSFRNRSW